MSNTEHYSQSARETGLLSEVMKETVNSESEREKQRSCLSLQKPSHEKKTRIDARGGKNLISLSWD